MKVAGLATKDKALAIRRAMEQAGYWAVPWQAKDGTYTVYVYERYRHQRNRDAHIEALLVEVVGKSCAELGYV